MKQNLEHFGHVDVFIEEIPYRQTLNYAKSAVENVARYRHIYHGHSGLTLTNAVNPSTTPTPNY